MKVFVLLLILINLGIFAWYRQGQDGEAVQTSAAETPTKPPEKLPTEIKPRVSEPPQPEPPSATTAPGQEVAAVPNPALCYEIGPLDEAPFMTLVAWLNEQQLAFDMTEIVVETIANYWVYLDPQKTAKAAQQTIKELKAKGIKDIHVIESGAQKNAVSLGLFKDEGTAKSRVSEIKKLGYSVQFKPRTESHTQYVVSLKDKFTTHLPQYVEAHPTIEPKIVECK